MTDELDLGSRPVPRRIRDGLSELYAYALSLDAELERLSTRIDALGRAADGAVEVRNLKSRQVEIAAELDLLRRTTAALRRTADPTGHEL